MKAKPARSKAPKARVVSVQIHLRGGHRHDLQLREGSPELAHLFRALASQGLCELDPSERFIQLPADEGRSAISFQSSQLVSVITCPPVVIRVEPPQTQSQTSPGVHTASPAPAVPPAAVETPRHLIIDDFLAVEEHHDMLAYAIANEARFEAGTVTTRDSHYRQNLVIMNFHEAAHSKLLCNRLLTWFPQITRMLGMDLFALGSVESQLTASNDGHYFRAHTDSGESQTEPRALSCVYYFFRQPRAFTGGALRLYDTCRQGDQSWSAASYREIEPVSNRLVVFPSETHHELMPIRCPSRKFADSRFAVTNWLHRAKKPDPDAAFGWGHLHCGTVPPGFGPRPERSK